MICIFFYFKINLPHSCKKWKVCHSQRGAYSLIYIYIYEYHIEMLCCFISSFQKVFLLPPFPPSPPQTLALAEAILLKISLESSVVIGDIKVVSTLRTGVFDLSNGEGGAGDCKGTDFLKKDHAQ